MLNNIEIRFNRKDFEYDVYSLVKAFYPQSQVEMFYGDEKGKGEYELVLTLLPVMRRFAWRQKKIKR